MALIQNGVIMELRCQFLKFNQYFRTLQDAFLTGGKVEQQEVQEELSTEQPDSLKLSPVYIQLLQSETKREGPNPFQEQPDPNIIMSLFNS